MGYQQYLRKVSLTLEGGGKAIGFDPNPGDSSDRQLRIRFNVRQGDTSTPPSADIYIYNLSKTTYESVRKEYKSITLEAGYEGNTGILFKGQIIQVRLYRENITDLVTHIQATSSEQARNYATVNKTLPPGHTFKDRVDVATQAMQKMGVTVGHIDDLGNTKFPKSFVCFGMAKDMLRDICFATGTQWHNHNGVFNLVKNENTLPGDTIVLNGNTGLVGFPEQTLEGVVARCLLNPKIHPAQKIQINQSSIQEAAISPAYGSQANNALLGPEGILGLAADGIYKALLVEHNGDNRGPNWYTEIICVKNQGGASIALAQRGIYRDTLQDSPNTPGNANAGATAPPSAPAFSGGSFNPGSTNVGQGTAPGLFDNVGTLGNSKPFSS
jgi:hypothetical protein